MSKSNDLVLPAPILALWDGVRSSSHQSIEKGKARYFYICTLYTHTQECQTSSTEKACREADINRQRENGVKDTCIEYAAPGNELRYGMPEYVCLQCVCVLNIARVRVCMRCTCSALHVEGG